MKKNGILNSHIAKVLADLGHTDYIAIGDIGLPIPDGVPKIDLALTYGVPSFHDVVEAVAADMQIEKVVIASEMADHNKSTHRYMTGRFADIELQHCSHEHFKQLTQNAKVIIRTGESKPYANCILQSGVYFG